MAGVSFLELTSGECERRLPCTHTICFNAMQSDIDYVSDTQWISSPTNLFGSNKYTQDSVIIINDWMNRRYHFTL